MIRAGDRRAAALDLLRLRVVAVVLEDAAGVLEAVLPDAAVELDADVAPGREVVGAERAIDEIVVRHAGELVEAERDLELADLHLRVLDVGQVDVDVLPPRLRRDAGLDVFLRQLLLGELVLDLVLDVLGEVALDAETVAVKLPGIEALHRPVRRVPVFLQLRFDVETEDVAVAHRGMLLPRERQPGPRRLGLGIDRLVRRRFLVFGDLVLLGLLVLFRLLVFRLLLVRWLILRAGVRRGHGDPGRRTGGAGPPISATRQTAISTGPRPECPLRPADLRSPRHAWIGTIRSPTPPPAGR